MKASKVQVLNTTSLLVILTVLITLVVPNIYFVTQFMSKDSVHVQVGCGNQHQTAQILANVMFFFYSFDAYRSALKLKQST